MKLANWLKRTQTSDADLARAIKRHRSTVSRIKRGLQIADPETARRIIAYTERKVGWRDLMETA